MLLKYYKKHLNMIKNNNTDNRDIKVVFTDRLEHIKWNMSFYNELKKVRLSWVGKDPMYAEFLGGNTIGVQPIRYSAQDMDMLFIHLLGIDRTSLDKELSKLVGIEKTFIVSSDVTYLTLGYIMHKFATLPIFKNVMVEAIRNTYYIFAYRALGSMMYHWFGMYNLDQAVAIAAFEKLTNQYLIKKLGSWEKLLEYRANDLLPNGAQWDRVTAYTTSDATRMVADLQGALKDQMVNLRGIIEEILKSGSKINVVSKLETYEENITLSDVSNQYIEYKNYIHTIIAIPADFVDTDLIYVLLNILDKSNIKQNDLVHILSSISKLYNDKKIEADLIDKIIITSIEYLTTKGIINNYHVNLIVIIKTLKGYWSASSVRHKDVLYIKNKLNTICKSNGIKQTNKVVTLVIFIAIYIFIKAVVKKH